MPGPSPKDPKLRQRRNKASTRSELRHEPPMIQWPVLPNRGGKDARPWHTLTQQWWSDLGKSPMAEKFLASDRHQLFVLAELVDAFWYQPTVTLASEIRQQSDRFGLAPIARRRLEWNIRDDRKDQVEDAADAPMKGAGRPIRPPSRPGATDVRRLLQRVK